MNRCIRPLRIKSPTKTTLLKKWPNCCFWNPSACIILKTLTFDYKGQRLNFREVFSYHYVEEHGDEAVLQIQTAFDELKLHKDYVVVDDEGNANPIFDEKTHLRLIQTRNYETLLKAISGSGAGH